MNVLTVNILVVNLPKALHHYSSNNCYYDCLTEMIQLAVYLPECFSNLVLVLCSLVLRKYTVPTVTGLEVPFIQSMQYNWPPQKQEQTNIKYRW